MNMMRYKKGDDNSQEWYIYTADDERIGVLDPMKIRWTIRGLDGQVLREFEGPPFENDNRFTDFTDETWKWVEDYVYREGQLVAAERQPELGGRRHFHLDHLGTPRLITNQNGLKFALHDYFAFGVEETNVRQEMELFAHDRPDPKKYTSHKRDFTVGTHIETQHYLDYMHARYYNPSAGRFLSVDPLLGRMSPSSWSRYAYVSNNPINYVDPWGLAERKPGEQMDKGDTCDGVAYEGICYDKPSVTVYGSVPWVPYMPGVPGYGGGPGTGGLLPIPDGDSAPCVMEMVNRRSASVPGLLVAAVSGNYDHGPGDVLMTQNDFITRTLPSWFGAQPIAAITFGNVIVYNSSADLPNNPALLRHERVHTRQYSRQGVLFYPDYVTQSLFNALLVGDGYNLINQELEANRAGALEASNRWDCK